MYFEKVSFEQFKEDAIKCGFANEDSLNLRNSYDGLQYPCRGTTGSAGYDFFAPFDLNCGNKYIVVPTGFRLVKERKDENYFLMCVPRSGLGFKNGLRLRNTCGIIDMDYCFSDNEGHIMAKLAVEENTIIPCGKAFMQGIILPFITVSNDRAFGTRNGGFGSTSK